MDESAASIRENPTETETRRERVVWGKLGGYPHWPGITYKSWEHLASDGVQGVNFSLKLRDSKTIVLFFESFTFQVLSKDSIKRYAEMDHRHVLATAKPRWKDKLTKAVEDAERYLAGMSVPQIMFARKEANEEVKTASKRKAHKQPMQPALESAPKSKAFKRTTSSSRVGRPRGSQKIKQPPVRKVDAVQQTTPPTLNNGGQSRLGGSALGLGVSTPVDQLRQATRQNISMLNSVLHAAQIQQQLIGTYLAQYQQQALLGLMAQDYLLEPSRTPELHALQFDTNAVQQRLNQSYALEHNEGAGVQQLPPVSIPSLEQVFQVPSAASNIFNQHLEPADTERVVSSFGNTQADSISDVAEKGITPFISATDNSFVAGTKHAAVDEQTIVPKEGKANRSRPGDSNFLNMDGAHWMVSHEEVRHAEVSISTSPLKQQPSPEPEPAPEPTHGPAPEPTHGPAPEPTHAPTPEPTPAPALQTTVEPISVAVESLASLFSAADLVRSRTTERNAGPANTVKGQPAGTPKAQSLKVRKTRELVPSARAKSRTEANEEKSNVKQKQPALPIQKIKAPKSTKGVEKYSIPHKHALLAFWELPMISIIKTAIAKSESYAGDPSIQWDGDIFAWHSTEYLTSLDVRNDDWFSDESESSRTDDDLLGWVGDALELVVDKRSRRKIALTPRTPADVAHSLRASDRLNDHTLVDSATYSDNLAQPFALKVHPQVSAVADLHAHCCDAEVIGFLAGWYEKDTKILYIQFAVPCTSTDRIDDGSTDVELDPEAAILAKERILERGLDLVGWYHTHPRFKAEPSVTDVFNHQSQQAMFEHPFVGLIVSTFDAGAAKVRASHRWFHTMDWKGVVVPMALEPTIRAIDHEHADIAVPYQLPDFIGKQVEAELLEGDPSSWQPFASMSPRKLSQMDGGALISEDHERLETSSGTSPVSEMVHPTSQSSSMNEDAVNPSISPVFHGHPPPLLPPPLLPPQQQQQQQYLLNPETSKDSTSQPPARNVTTGDMCATIKPPLVNIVACQPTDLVIKLANQGIRDSGDTESGTEASDNLSFDTKSRALAVDDGVSTKIPPTRAAEAPKRAKKSSARSTRIQSTSDTLQNEAISPESQSKPLAKRKRPGPSMDRLATLSTSPHAGPSEVNSYDILLAAMGVAGQPIGGSLLGQYTRQFLGADYADAMQRIGYTNFFRDELAPVMIQHSAQSQSSSCAELMQTGSNSQTGQQNADQGTEEKPLPLRGAGGPDVLPCEISDTERGDDMDELSGDHQNRRASHRVPKRKQFDDEKLEGFAVKKRTKPIGRPPKAKNKRNSHPSSTARAKPVMQKVSIHASPQVPTRSPVRSKSDQSARDLMCVYLRGHNTAATKARRLIATARPFLQIFVQSVVVIGIYYAGHPRRVGLSQRWRQACKLDKIVYSMGSWLLYLGMPELDVHRLSFEIRDFLSAAWELHSSNVPSS